MCEGTRSGDVIISKRTGSAMCVVTRVLEDGDETGPVEYMGAYDADVTARRIAGATNASIWERVDGGKLTKL